MQIVLLSGGSGKRLWPLSNEIRSKAFLRLLRSETGGTESMIQRVCRGLAHTGLLQSCSIVTHQSQVEITRSHIGDAIPILGEPQKRGTFTAVALAASYLYSVRGISPAETVVVLPVDSYVDRSFYELLHRLPAVLADSQADIALIGSVPRSPSAEFGYIVPQEGNVRADYFTVAKFIEKPVPTVAGSLIARQALWNCGVFACSLQFLLTSLKDRGLPLDYREFRERYDEWPQESFDREVLEKTRHAVAIPYNGTWKDLGTWGSLTAHLEEKVYGAGRISEDCSNTHLVNELPCPVYVIGVSDLIVAACPDGILVGDKSRVHLIKDELGDLPVRTMYEEKRWGTCRVLDDSRTELNKDVVTRKIELHAGKSTSYHWHRHTEECWTILSGSGEYMLDGIVCPISAGGILRIPAGTRHAIKAETALVFLQVEIGGSGGEEDLIREPLDGKWASS
ncbi:mannose-1-phosphate guanylyltransferase [Paenibacillus albidus]|uniref:Mannose-1-phosphate guanylyltransferase n=1 Tax=Paenibacillus albidus TaxID=2041023 RepID=A0A917C010_9BACL|nr:sugar phosphate nucleotidyltransferase [Paenibacillus albidus]GGF65724.1 mannose-1-phosphate guanylyltransferase [Paenibacillus albidus]